MLYRKFLTEKKKSSEVLSEFVFFLKLGLLWGNVEIFIANFSPLSPNRFWRIFSMLLNSHLIPSNSVEISLMLNHNCTGLLAANILVEREGKKIRQTREEESTRNTHIFCLYKGARGKKWFEN